MERRIPGLLPATGSRYLRCTSLLVEAGAELRLPGGYGIRRLSTREASDLEALLRKRNVFARHSWENNFYLKRVAILAEQTVVEVRAEGDPNDAMAGASQRADLLEMLAVLCPTFGTNRSKLHRLLGITARPAGEVDLIHSDDLRYVRSHSRSTHVEGGIPVDARFIRRFERLAFPRLYDFCCESTALSSRVQSSLNWLLESRKEINAHAAVVKSVIALEMLLISSESEPLARTLSERMAFLLGSDPREREQVSSLVRSTYSVRSGVVHGGKRKTASFSERSLESLDRLVLLACLTIAANTTLWPSMEILCQWCETERWSAPSLQAASPFPRSYLRRALELAEHRPQGRA
jgi:hypothetical protein